LFPRADPATVSVALALPGASPDEMSTSVVEPMEQAISGVSGIDEIQARIAEGSARLIVRFVLERDLNEAVNDVREKWPAPFAPFRRRCFRPSSRRSIPTPIRSCRSSSPPRR
jgi:multidrug efflux pump subunit AcrB